MVTLSNPLIQYTRNQKSRRATYLTLEEGSTETPTVFFGCFRDQVNERVSINDSLVD